MYVRHTGYIRPLFESPARRAKTISDAVRRLSKVEFDAVACAGVSGITFGSIIAHILDKHLIIVRKEQEDCHTIVTVEGVPVDTNISYVFVDDFIATGRTFVRVVNRIYEANTGAKCIGIYQYNVFNDRRAAIRWTANEKTKLMISPDGEQLNDKAVQTPQRWRKKS